MRFSVGQVLKQVCGAEWMSHPPVLPQGQFKSPARDLLWLINPFYPKDARTSFGKHVLTPSLALTSLAAATPPDFQVKYWDENLLQGQPHGPLPGLAAITVHLSFASRAYQLAAWLRARGTRVVMGGPHALACSAEVGRHADAVVVGNGVSVWPQVLDDYRQGRLRQCYLGSYHAQFLEEPIPDRAPLPSGAFLTRASVIASRGCHNRCEFCLLATRELSLPLQKRPPQAVAAELQAIGEPYAVFLDNNLGSDPRYLRELCAALAPLKIIWSAALSLDAAADPGLVRAMALSGCTGVFIGFESLNSENLAQAGKPAPSFASYARQVACFHEWGIQVNGSFVFGFDADDAKVFDQTAGWIEEQRLECATFHILTPYPGTPLFARLEAEGRILTRDWDLYDTGHVVFRPARMTVEDLQEGYTRIYKRTFSLTSIWRRRPLNWHAVPPYLAMAWLYKRANWLWPMLIHFGWTAACWQPLVRLSRRRHLHFREQLRARPQIPPDIFASASRNKPFGSRLERNLP